MKKLLSFLVALFATIAAYAYDQQVNGIYYTFDSSARTATVTYASTSYSSYSGAITVPEQVVGPKSLDYTVTAIGASAFRKCSSLTEIKLPPTIESIGDYAFSGCSRITAVSVPAFVETIGSYAFDGCTALKTVTLPKNFLTAVAPYTFRGCSSLEQITIPSTVTAVGDYAFSGCSSLLSASLSTATESIGTNAFYNCRALTALDIPAKVTTIGSSAFEGCSSMASVTLRDGLTTIGSSAFAGCTALSAIDVPNSVASLGASTFSGDTKLATVKLSTALTSLPDNLFKDCTALASLTVPAAVTTISSTALSTCSALATLTFAEGMTTIPRSYATNVTSVKLPATAETIAAEAFRSFAQLTSITIPAGVKTLPANALWDCPKLAAITVASGNSVYDSRQNCNAVIETATNTLICGCNTTTIPAGVTAIGASAFQYCTTLTSISLPSSIQSIGNEAFRGCSLLPAVTLPANLTSIGTNAFADCTKLTALTYADGTRTALRSYATALTSVTIPHSCLAFAEKAFEGCTKLADVYIEDLEMWNYIFLSLSANPFSCPRTLHLNGAPLTDLIADFGAPVAHYAFANVKGLKNVTLTGSILGVGDNAFTNSTDLESVVMGNYVASIGKGAFLGCNNLQSLKLGSGTTTIGESAFEGCAALNSVRMGGNERTIGRRAFYGCSSIPRLRLPDGLTSIGDYAFSGCQSLADVNLPDGLTELRPHAFEDCRSLAAITFPVAVTSIGDYAFSGCALLPRLELGNALTTIGANAFAGCSSVRVAYLGSGVTSIGSQAFANCTNLLGFYIAAANVPTTQSNAFSGSEPEYINLYVPEASVSAYKAKSPWSTIRSIEALDAAPVYATRLTLTPEAMILDEGDMQTFTVTTFPAGASTAVNWTSANTDVAYVSSKGAVLANGKGTTTVTAKAADGYGARATATVIVTDHFVPLTSVRLDAASLTLTEGDEHHLTASVLPTAATYPTVRWESANERIATVTDDGVVTALATGRTTITARSADGTGLTASCALTVEEPYYSTLAMYGDANGDYSVSDRDIAAVTDLLLGNRGGIDRNCDVNGDGHVGVGDVAAVIEILKKGDSEGERSEPVAMSIYPAKATIAVSETPTCQLTASFVPHRATAEVKWTSSHPEVATVNASGLVEAQSLGSCTITAITADGRFTAEAEIEVKFTSVPDDVHYDEWTSTNHSDSSTSSHTYTIDYGEGDTIEFDWSVSSESNYDYLIVTLDGSEVLKKSGTDSGHYTKTFTKSGTATLLAKYTKDSSTSKGDDQGRIYNIILKREGGSGSSTLTINPQSVLLKPDETYQLNISPVLPVTWTSSNPAVATVSSTGVVTAVADGECVITATWLYGVKAECKVFVGSETVTFSVDGVTFNMKLVKHGSFQMGSTSGESDEKPVHSVTISKDYYIGETEVTQALWYAVMGQKPTSDGNKWSSSVGLGDDYPAYYISWNDCQTFITKLNQLTGQTFRMPTEAEWEYAAKGGNKSQGYTYSGSNTIGDVAWYTSNSSSKTHPVASKKPNELGIYDMIGNVWEWCSDRYSSSYYTSSAVTDPTGPTSGSNRVLRGGSCNYDASYCRTAYRNYFTPTYRNGIGLRLALSPSK